jgi:hypothetical protein
VVIIAPARLKCKRQSGVRKFFLLGVVLPKSERKESFSGHFQRRKTLVRQLLRRQILPSVLQLDEKQLERRICMEGHILKHIGKGKCSPQVLSGLVLAAAKRLYTDNKRYTTERRR